MNKISIRNAKFAKIGLQDMINYINHHSNIRTKEMTMIEIGSYVGDSTKIFADNFGNVICIDPYKNGYDDNDASSYLHPMDLILKQFREDVLNKYSNVSLIIKPSVEAVKNFKDQVFDFVYIDGDHTKQSMINDLTHWRSKTKLWMGGHDYGNKCAPDVKPEVDKFFNTKIKTFRDLSWLVRI